MSDYQHSQQGVYDYTEPQPEPTSEEVERMMESPERIEWEILSTLSRITHGQREMADYLRRIADNIETQQDDSRNPF